MVTRRRERSKCAHNRTNLSEKEQPMRTLALCAALFAATATAFAGPQESELRASGRAAIEKAVLEVNAQLTREGALATVKRNFQGLPAIKYRWKRQLVTVISATTALLVCDGESEVRPAQDPPATFVTPFAQSVLFVLTDGKWKALHAHMSTVPR